MTATHSAPYVCPSCSSQNTMHSVTGVGRCFDCAHEWDPTQVHAEPAVPLEGVPAPFGMAPVEEVIEGVEHEAADLQAELVGGAVVLEGGQVGEVVAFPDDDHVEVLLGDGRTETVGFGDVVSIRPPVPVDPDVERELTGVEAEAQAALNVSLACLIIMAGVAATEGEGEQMTVGAAPVGYLPRDESMFETVERACALAVAFTMATFGVDPAALVNAVQAWQGAGVEGDQQQEETSE